MIKLNPPIDGYRKPLGLPRLRYEEALPVALEALEAAQNAGNVHWAAQDELQIGRILIYLGRFDEAEVRIDSAEATFRRASSSNDRLIQLDLAEHHGLSPDYSCRSGICRTCMCELVEGEVEYVEEPLNAPDPGCVLICVSKPKSKLVVEI